MILTNYERTHKATTRQSVWNRFYWQSKIQPPICAPFGTKSYLPAIPNHDSWHKMGRASIKVLFLLAETQKLQWYTPLSWPELTSYLGRDFFCSDGLKIQRMILAFYMFTLEHSFHTINLQYIIMQHRFSSSSPPPPPPNTHTHTQSLFLEFNNLSATQGHLWMNNLIS